MKFTQQICYYSGCPLLYNTYVCQGICPFHLMHQQKVVHNIPLLSFCISVDQVMMSPLLLLTLVICASLFFPGQFEKGLSILLISKITFIDFPYYFSVLNFIDFCFTIVFSFTISSVYSGFHSLFFFLFLKLEAGITDLRGFFISNIGIQYYNFPHHSFHDIFMKLAIIDYQYQLTKANITEYYKLGDLNNRNLFSHRSRG